MIISASRRTDIPAFYADWFMQRIRDGVCTVPNPFNAKQVSTISLLPEDVDAVVFWTRNARPLLPRLRELDASGYNYLFLYTVLDYPSWLETNSPPLDSAINTFRALANQIGPDRIVWRYDPLVFTPALNAEYHREKFAEIARRLNGQTHQVKISVMDEYAKTRRRMAEVPDQPVLSKEELASRPDFQTLMRDMASIAAAHGMEIHSCAETIDLTPFGIQPGKCMDDELLNRLFGLELLDKKDPSQRQYCLCTVSRDIGMYNSCLFGCQYCYATTSFEQSKERYKLHDPANSSLIGA